MGFFIGLGIIIFALVLRGKINDLKSELEYLKRKVEALETRAIGVPAIPPVPAMQTPESVVYQSQPAARVVPAVAHAAPDETHTFIDESDETDDFEPPFPGDVKKESAVTKPAFNFEQQFGAKLPVWIGGISLALAGFYMVKYSIENNLVSPSLRVVLGMMMGAAFIAAGHWLAKRPGIANATRICQALSGAGITCLYGGFFAASSLYHLIPPVAGFIGMVAVTAGAVILSLSQGAAVAVFGLVGGFLTPILIGLDEPNTMLLFIYLSVLSLSLLYLARRQNWDWLALPVYALSLLWALGWLVGAWVAVDAVWVSLYLLALLCAAPVVLLRSDAETTASVTTKVASAVGCLGSLVMLSLITAKADFTPLHWSMFGLAGLASITLAVFRPRLYHYAPAVAGVVTAVLLLLWQAPDPALYFKVAGILSAVYFAAGVSFAFRTQDPLWWGKIAILTSPVLYGISYFKYGPEIFSADLSEPVWTWAALFVAAVSVALTASLQRRLALSQGSKGILVALSSLLSVAFLSWGLYLALDGTYLMLAYAFQIAAVACLMQRFAYPFISLALKAATGLFLVALLPFGLELVNLFAVRQYGTTSPIAGMPLLHLAGAALLVAATACLHLPRQSRQALALIAGLLGTAVAFGILQAVVTKIDPALAGSFGWRAATLNLTWLAAMLTLWNAHRSGRSDTRFVGLLLLGYAAVQTIIVDLIFFFPDRSTEIEGVPLLNMLIPAYALPAACFCLVAKLLSRWHLEQYSKAADIAFLFFALLFVTCEVSHFFHAPYLDGSGHSLAEIYTYSVVWLVSGICLLVAGTLSRSRLYRIASLLVIGGTVCKVFLYDASELDGILRVISFLGLGLSLLGLSFFYTRFVFGRNDKP